VTPQRGLRDQDETAVLCSGGLDSVVLLASEARNGPVRPIYVSTGLFWEAAELDALDRVLKTHPLVDGRVGAPAKLQFGVLDLYQPTHWAVRGSPPSYDTPDEDVYLIGRNVILLSKASLFCAMHGIRCIALGPLAGNPFPDATPDFFDAMSVALSAGLAHRIQVTAPFLHLHKEDVVRLGVSLGIALEETLSCMRPADGLHCGLCSKCRERRDAFAAAGVEDRTRYASPSPR
jgi:7-cyano-7-deazaguanine synthase